MHQACLQVWTGDLELGPIARTEGKHSHKTFTWALLAAILGFYAAAAARFPDVYIWATYEDLFGEWVQFWSLVAALIVSARLALGRWRFRWFFVLLAASCFYVAMEEVSWGQRLFSFSSPEFFKAHNLQGETNLHNFFTGPYATTLKAALTWILAGALAAYGLVYPAALRRRVGAALWLEARGLAAPPLHLWPFFLAAAVLELSPFRFNEAEIAEILVGLALALMVTQYSFLRRQRLDLHQSADWPEGMGQRLTMRLCLVTVSVLGLAVGTTLAVYASPPHRARIDRRIANGVEKFAGRYARHGQWQIASDLYRRVHAAEPGRVSIMRKLAQCYRSMGDQLRYAAFLDKALVTDLTRDRKEPGRASVQRSLARTYRTKGDDRKAGRCLQEALRIGLKRVKRNPTSASAAFSLGKTYALMERREDALDQLSRAYDSRPTSKKYRKAYYAALKELR